VRILPTALVVSAALHGGAIAWVKSRPVPKPEPRKPLTLELAPTRAESPPTEVTLLDDNTVAALTPLAHAAGSSRPRGKARHEIASTHATIPGETAPVPSGQAQPSEPAPPRSRLMTMRHPELANGPSAAFWDRFAANTKPLAPKDIAGEQLASEIESAESHVSEPRWVQNATPEQLAAERAKLVAKRYERSHAELRPDGAGTKAQHRTFEARFHADGTVASIDDKANLQREGLGASFDVTDAMMRRHGMDPYASYKRKVLDETREERVAIGKRYRTQQLAQSRQLVQRNIERLWATTTDLDGRKQGLFELWDDCAETGSDELVAGGAAARAQVIGFIRSRLPAGSESAYTADELARFNKQRKSRSPFSPYDAPR
jgi:hypothetical protein